MNEWTNEWMNEWMNEPIISLHAQQFTCPDNHQCCTFHCDGKLILQT